MIGISADSPEGCAAATAAAGAAIELYRDPDARWPFPWHDLSVWDRDMLQHVGGLIALRHRYAALRTGEFVQVLADGSRYALLRRDATDTLLVVLNVSETGAEVGVPVQPHAADGERFDVVFGGEGHATVSAGRVRIDVPARSGLALRAATPPGRLNSPSAGWPRCASV